MITNVIETERLILRTWQASDIEPYYAIMQDPKVTELLLGPLTREQISVFIERSNKAYAEEKYCLFAVEEKASGNLIGYVGLCKVPYETPFTPAIEIGWRLGSQYWGKGYATEAARAVLSYAFTVLKLTEVVSFTSTLNVRSMRVMEKIGMQRDMNGDFAHPRLAPDHTLSKHVLYRITAP